MKSKKTILSLIISLASLTAAVAQYGNNSESNYIRPANDRVDQATNNIISFGLGMGGNYPYLGTASIEDPGMSLFYQNTIIKNAGLGSVVLCGVLSYKCIYTSYQDYFNNYTYQQRWNYYIMGARVSYHIFPFANKSFEFYAGAMYAYYLTRFKFSSNDPNTSEPGDPGNSLASSNASNFFSPGIFAGVRAWISLHSSVWLETGYGYSALAFGASYRI